MRRCSGVTMNRAMAGVLTGALAAGARAQTWNLYSGFSATANPAGVWTYGWEPAVGGAFTPYDRPIQIGPEMQGWTSSRFPTDTPLVGVNQTPDVQRAPGTMIEVPPGTAW